MRCIRKIVWVCGGMLAVFWILHGLGYDAALAAEQKSNWRGTYDLIMRWVNFGIIVFVLNRYAKGPVINFLQGRGKKVAEEIKTLEDRRDETVAKIKETQKAVDESEALFADLKQRIVQMGEKKKEEIIATARQQSRNMLNDAHRRVDSHLLEAKSAVKAELVDFAIDLAMQQLPQNITDSDNQKFTDEFINSTQAK